MLHGLLECTIQSAFIELPKLAVMVAPIPPTVHPWPLENSKRPGAI